MPIVRQVGGLADSVSHWDGTPAGLETATGFVFAAYTADAFTAAAEQALNAWQNAAVWNRLVQNGMRRDWSWQQSASQYEGVYREALGKVAQRQAENRL